MSDMQEDEPRSPSLGLIIGGLLFAGALHLFRRPPDPEEARRQAAERRAEKARQAKIRAEKDRQYREKELGRSLGLRYFATGGEGRRLLDNATVTTISVGDPYPDAIRARHNGPISSQQARAELDLAWQVQDGMGTLWLRYASGQVLECGFTQSYDNGCHLHLAGDDLETFRIIARLLASADRGVVALEVRRSDWRQIRDQLWTEYLSRHPEVAAEIGWTGSGPYDL